MALVDDVATYLEGAGLGYVLEENLFKRKMPNAPHTGAWVIPMGGAPGNFGFGTPGLQDDMPGITVRTRGEPEQTVEPEAAAYAIYLKLPQIQAQQVGGSFVRMFRPVAPPFRLEEDGSKREVWSVNFLVERKL